MKEYRFDEETSESIVQGIMKGYKSYLHERIQKKQELKISSAYAWVKGNHIDHFVAEESKTFGITFTPSKAGYSWGYLQFQNLRDKVLFLIKNGSSIEKKASSAGSNNEENYLEKLAKINKGINFSTEKTNQNEQLELRLYDSTQVSFDSVLEEVGELENEFDRFYIITYTLDEQKMISNISLCLPNPDTKELIQVDSWERFFSKIDIAFQEEDFEGVKDDKEIATQVTIGDYGIVIEDDKDEEKES